VSDDNLFDLIESVVAKRRDQVGRYTIKQLILDVMKTTAERDTDIHFSCGDLRAVAGKLGQTASYSGTRQSIADYIASGQIVFVGRESRANNVGSTSKVPVYRAVLSAD